MVIGYSEVANPRDVVQTPGGSYVYLYMDNANIIASCPIVQDKDDTWYVDQESGNCGRDDRFVCVPSIIGTDKCPDGTSLQAGNEGESCSPEGIMGYFIEGDERCEKSCEDGEIVVGDCVKIVDAIVPPA